METETTRDEFFMRRALQLAYNGNGYVSPNPMVGAVIVCDGKIIGEGWHRHFGGPHAEVNAVNSVTDKSLLKRSRMYVTLEPCSHYGKTPPCAEMIIRLGIPEVVVACRDPFKEVSGRGITMLREAGIDVKVGVLQDEAELLNIKFMTAHRLRRPYILLKWAETADGFIGGVDDNGKPSPIAVSTPFTKMLSHKLRTEYDAIMVGATTVLTDNPSLTARYYPGRNPARIVIAPHTQIPASMSILDNQAKTIIYSNTLQPNTCIVEKFISLPQVMSSLYEKGITSVIAEGGKYLIETLISSNLYDMIRVERNPGINIGSGIKAPKVPAGLIAENSPLSDNIICYRKLLLQ